MIPKYNIQRIRKKIMANYADYLPPVLSFNFISQEKFLRRLDELKTGIINRLKSSDGVLDLQVAKDLDRFFQNQGPLTVLIGKQVSDLPDLLLLEGEDDVRLSNPILTNVRDLYVNNSYLNTGLCDFDFECMPSFDYEFFIPVYQPIRIEIEQRRVLFTRSDLDAIPGVGPALQSALLRYFGSVKAIADASLTELIRVEGVGDSMAEQIVSYFRRLDGLPQFETVVSQMPTEEGFVLFDGEYYDGEGDEVSFAKFDDDGEQQYLLEENGDLVFETSQKRVSIPIPVVKHDLTPEGDVIAYTLPPGTDFEDKVEYASELLLTSADTGWGTNIQGKVIVQTRALEDLMNDEVRQLTEIIENMQPERLHAMAKRMGFVT